MNRGKKVKLKVLRKEDNRRLKTLEDISRGGNQSTVGGLALTREGMRRHIFSAFRPL